MGFTVLMDSLGYKGLKTCRFAGGKMASCLFMVWQRWRIESGSHSCHSYLSSLSVVVCLVLFSIGSMRRYSWWVIRCWIQYYFHQPLTFNTYFWNTFTLHALSHSITVDTFQDGVKRHQTTILAAILFNSIQDTQPADKALLLWKSVFIQIGPVSRLMFHKQIIDLLMSSRPNDHWHTWMWKN